MITVSVIGGSGYIGGEVLRILSTRKDIEIIQVTSQSQLGQHVHSTHPNLRNILDLRFTSPEDLEDADVIFSALPHGTSNRSMRDVMKHSDHVIDLSADFRLNSVEEYGKWYGEEHSAPELMKEFPYGLPEIHREEIAEKGRAAAPGCVATSMILGLYPFRDIAQRVLVDSKIGSSASGRSSSAASHHPERSGTIRPYAAVGHRHTAEVLQETGLDVMITVHAVEMVRGISSTIHIDLESPVQEKEIWKRLRDAYGDERFIRIVKANKGLFRYPEPKFLIGSNFCDIGFELDRKNGRLVVFSAIDNLMKGGAGSGVQCMNTILGLDESLGLEFPGLHPV